MGKICLISNFASDYRTAIYVEMSRQLGCDFVFGNKCSDIKKMDYSLLSSNVTDVNISKVGPLLWQPKAIRQLFKPYDKYIVLGQPNFVTTWILLILAKFTKKKIYLWTHGWYGRESAVKKIVKKIFFGLADGLFVYGDYAINLMIKEGFSKNKLHAIHNSLDYDKQLDIRKNISQTPIYTNHFKNSNPNLIFIGRLTKVKQLDMILDMLRISNDDQNHYNLTYIGSGEDEQRLRELTKQYGLADQVWFYGACYEERELAELIYNADLCIAPGNVGLTAIHCLTYGCPIITHNDFTMQMPEFEVIKAGVTGDFFECNNLESLIDTVDNWFLASHNRDDIRKVSYQVIDKSWNPHYQIQLLKSVLLK